MKHLEEMSDMVRLGCRAVMVYLVQCAAPIQFRLAQDLDPGYAKAYAKAKSAGVEAVALTCTMTPQLITPAREIPILE